MYHFQAIKRFVSPSTFMFPNDPFKPLKYLQIKTKQHPWCLYKYLLGYPCCLLLNGKSIFCNQICTKPVQKPNSNLVFDLISVVLVHWEDMAISNTNTVLIYYQLCSVLCWGTTSQKMYYNYSIKELLREDRTQWL